MNFLWNPISVLENIGSADKPNYEKTIRIGQASVHFNIFLIKTGALKIIQTYLKSGLMQGRSLATGRCISPFKKKILKVEIIYILEKINKNDDKRYFLAIIMH